jgi:hypothetical protein
MSLVAVACSALLAAQPARSATPGLAFAQIDRLLFQGATPSPAGSFAEDAERIASLVPLRPKVTSEGEVKAQVAGTMLVSGLLGLIPVAGSFLAAGAAQASNAAFQAKQQQQQQQNNAALQAFIRAGTLSRFAFYGSWTRDESAGHEIRIEKPDQHLTILLNPQTKTARTIGAQNDDTYVIETDSAVPPLLQSAPTTERLADLTLDGRALHGYRTTGTFSLAQSLGFCKHGTHAAVQVEYVAAIDDPQPQATAGPDAGLADGCAPVTTASYREPGKLVVYRATTIDAGAPEATGCMFERSDIRPIDERDAALFSIPPGYTQEHS